MSYPVNYVAQRTNIFTGILHPSTLMGYTQVITKISHMYWDVTITCAKGLFALLHRYWNIQIACFYKFYERDHKYVGYNQEIIMPPIIYPGYTTVWHFDLPMHWGILLHSLKLKFKCLCIAMCSLVMNLHMILGCHYISLTHNHTDFR